MNQIKTVKQAVALVGPLGTPSKMPGKSYGLPAAECKVGSKLREIPGSVCSHCYALRGNYQYANVLESQYRRLASITDPQWVNAICYLIEKQVSRSDPYFRWHDSGDLQSIGHLIKIVQIAQRCQWVNFWLPTREAGIVREYLRTFKAFPSNLRVRVSQAMIDGDPPAFEYTSGVHTRDAKYPGVECKAYTRENHCGSCRVCWQRYRHVSYKVH